MEERPSSSGEVLHVSNLTISFGAAARPVVSDISFSIRAGETLGVVGESGSGKTITGLALLGLLPPGAQALQGEMLLQPEGKEPIFLNRLTERELTGIRGRHISMIFQEPMTSLNPGLRCGFQVSEVLRQHFSGRELDFREETLFWLREVRLPSPEKVYRSYPHELSGGQRQRVMIAMALCTRPAVLIADEPTTALDVTIQQAIISLLKDLQEKHGTSILFITHDLALIGELAHRILVMQHGKMVEQGPAGMILNRPEHPYTQGLLKCRPDFSSRPLRLPTVREFLEKGRTETIETDRRVLAARKKEMYSHPPLLEIKNLKTWFPIRSGPFAMKKHFTRAVDGVSFDVYEGETLGLVGESGCGKTTLGRSLLQLVNSHSGSILYRGKNTLTYSRSELQAFRQKFQIIFQDPFSSLNPRITAGESIMEPMKVHGIFKNRSEREKAMHSLLEKVRLEPSHAGRYPHEFSGGQRQRIGIARVLALKPQFLVCDESVSSLDVSVQAEILNLLNELKEDFGLTYIFISHDLSVVRYMSDRILVMRNGRVVEEGDALQLFDDPKEDYTRELIAAVPGTGNTG